MIAEDRNYRVSLMSTITTTFFSFSYILFVMLATSSSMTPFVSSHPMPPKLQQAPNTLARNNDDSVTGGPIVLDALADEGHVLEHKRLLNRRKNHARPFHQNTKILSNTDYEESSSTNEDRDNLILMMNASRRLLENRLDADAAVVVNDEASQHKLRLKFRRLRVCFNVCLFVFFIISSSRVLFCLYVCRIAEKNARAMQITFSFRFYLLLNSVFCV